MVSKNGLQNRSEVESRIVPSYSFIRSPRLIDTELGSDSLKKAVVVVVVSLDEKEVKMRTRKPRSHEATKRRKRRQIR